MRSVAPATGCRRIARWNSRLAHARARDAVHAPLDHAALIATLAELSPILVQSKARDRATFLQRPDLGRTLAADLASLLPQGAYDAAVVISDGLSAAATQGQAAKLCRMLLAARNFTFAPPVVALQARVALGDEIAARLGARMVVALIGERPGLSACDSLGAYITYDPKPGLTRDAERNCVSNIRPDGLSLEDASRRILAIMSLARAMGRTGAALKEDDALALAPPDKDQSS
ncbi:ethanolamine ammonia-lyase subunit EutC [Methylocapsa polymorpha]|uniref:Ethanolamine ammonia-lyase small subunit n=1 Tax=Methylocapsa polymorpha TaxID=3080828 RepID=A0ABZ0HY03_9HYPH|nr:ethanolamine ammonia-lyase subunit EutC [Methylocapsa sp. RX1]